MRSTIQITGDDLVVVDKTPGNDDLPPPVPLPPLANGGLMWPKSQDELQTLWQAALDTGTMLTLDPRTRIDVKETISLSVSGKNGGWPHGIDGNYARLHSSINDGSPMVLVESKEPNRCMVMERLGVYGGGYDGRVSGGIVFVAAKGVPIYKAKFNDLYISYCTTGLSLIGDIYESEIKSPHVENCFEDGICLEDDGQAVISNLVIDIPNLSRNQGYGLRLKGAAGSVDVRYGSFVLNGLGGIHAPNGIRTVERCNFENTGRIAIDVPFSAWDTSIVGCKASTEGKTLNQQALERYGEAVGPLLHLYRYGGPPDNFEQSANRVNYYGDAPNPTAVRAP